jgi:predicted dehydrogenase
MLKACIIGVSGYGRIHYDLLMQAQAEGSLEVVGATIINQADESEKCARLRELGCHLYDDYLAMLAALAGKADLCLIPTGTPLHRPMTVAALEAGMHVLVEKPAAGCIEDVRAMQRAVQEAKRMVAVGYQHLYAPSTMETKRHILDGTIGRLESVKSLVMWPRDHSYYSRNGWAGRLSVGGTTVNDSPFNNAVAHELMMMLFQAGAAEHCAALPVSVKAELFHANNIESADTACMQIETAEGVPVRFYATHACRETFGPEIHFRGTKGSIVMTHTSSVIMLDGKTPITLLSGGASCERRAMLDNVMDVVSGGSSFICDLEMAARQTMAVSMIHDCCTVQAVEGETVKPESGPLRTFIPGIEAIMREAFAEERTIGAALGSAPLQSACRDDQGGSDQDHRKLQEYLCQNDWGKRISGSAVDSVTGNVLSEQDCPN